MRSFLRLVATLGSQTSLTKKVHKKDILEVNLRKACDTIMHSDTPLALRLQSNLLYGASRVFKEQYQYFFHDVTSAHLKISKEILAMQVDSPSVDQGRWKAK